MLHCKNDDKYYTHTTDGIVPHLRARIGGYDMCMPVKIRTNRTGAPDAVKDKYGYVYSLPAGRVISTNGEIRR